MKVLAFPLLLLFSFYIYPQNQLSLGGNYRFTGKVITPAGEVPAGIDLFFKKEKFNEKVTPDSEGAFSIGLPIGNYQITASENFSREFIAFINITDTGINPSEVEFVLKPIPDPCDLDSKCPRLTKKVAPRYPPAARAVRVSGVVLVSVKLNKEGKVTVAKATSGHPLLKVASEVAARACEFVASSEDERETNISFFYLTFSKKEGIKYYEPPNRIYVFAPEPVVQVTSDPGVTYPPRKKSR